MSAGHPGGTEARGRDADAALYLDSDLAAAVPGVPLPASDHTPVG